MMIRVTRRQCVATALAAAVLLAGVFVNAGLAQNKVATIDKPAEFVLAPAAGAEARFLEISVSAYKPPPSGAVDIVVTLAGRGDSTETELGRFAIFPSEPFTARSAAEERKFRIDARAAAAAMTSAGQITVRVKLAAVDTSRSPAGAELTVSRVALTGS